PPDADAATRARLGYNALARLAGPDCGRFTALARWLGSRGLSAPQVLAADTQAGFVLLEDLGDALFARIIAAGTAEAPLYERAIDALAHLAGADAPSGVSAEDGRTVPLLAYDAVARGVEAGLLVEWFLPRALGRAADDAMWADYRRLWAGLEPVLSAGPSVLVLRDFHAENLLWLGDRPGVRAVGLLDFQDAVIGSPLYDLVSLLEDARRDVDPELALRLRTIARGRLSERGLDGELFEAAFAAHAAQRNAKIVGIFARLAIRDGKPAYLRLLPRVFAHLTRDLAHPALGELRRWFDETIPPSRRTIDP
ncbi:MAG: phosphotransferase, partial [Alphaproteobacteria bacterium]|nr:phosphotransferase [Alphaproteobacteria bacterium]